MKRGKFADKLISRTASPLRSNLRQDKETQDEFLQYNNIKRDIRLPPLLKTLSFLSFEEQAATPSGRKAGDVASSFAQDTFVLELRRTSRYTLREKFKAGGVAYEEICLYKAS